VAITTRAPARSRRAISVAAAMNGASTASPTRRLIVPYLEAIAEAPYLFDGALVKKLNQLYPDSLDHAPHPSKGSGQRGTRPRKG